MSNGPWRPLLATTTLMAALVATPAPLRAIGTTGALDGTVEDARGRPIAGAAVTLASKRGGQTLARTDENGFFRIPAQPTEAFVLRVDAEGFRPVEYDGLQLKMGRTRHFDVRLKRPGERDVVVLLSRDPYPFDDLLRGLLQGLDAPARTFDLDTVPDPADVVRRVEAERPNLILASGLMAAHLVRSEIRDIPAVLSQLGDPRKHDLDAANLSYVATNAPAGELMTHVREFLPEARRLGLLFDAHESTFVARDLRRAARERGFDVITRPCYGPGKIAQALAEFAGKVDVLVVPFDPLSLSPNALDDITHWSLSQRVALVGPAPEWVRRGALFSYGPTPETIGRDLSLIAAKMLFEGLQPQGDARLIGPGGSVLTVNETTALALGVEIPGSVSVDATY